MSHGSSVKLAFQPLDSRIVRRIETDVDPNGSVHRKQGLQRCGMSLFEGWIPLQRMENDVFERHKARLLEAECCDGPDDIFEGVCAYGNLVGYIRVFAQFDLLSLDVAASDLVILQLRRFRVILFALFYPWGGFLSTLGLIFARCGAQISPVWVANWTTVGNSHSQAGSESNPGRGSILPQSLISLEILTLRC